MGWVLAAYIAPSPPEHGGRSGGALWIIRIFRCQVKEAHGMAIRQHPVDNTRPRTCGAGEYSEDTS